MKKIIIAAFIGAVILIGLVIAVANTQGEDNKMNGNLSRKIGEKYGYRK